MNIDEKIAILQAEKAGEEIQYFSELRNAWRDTCCVTGIDLEYRVKPKPRRHWCNDYDGHLSDVKWGTKDAAKRALHGYAAAQVEFVEVIK